MEWHQIEGKASEAQPCDISFETCKVPRSGEAINHVNVYKLKLFWHQVLICLYFMSYLGFPCTGPHALLLSHFAGVHLIKKYT